MQFPTNMALAAFDPLETSYLSAISLKEYFAERKVGNFREGQSIREQSQSLLCSHTVWDVLEYRLLRMLHRHTQNCRVSTSLSVNITEFIAEVVDRCEENDFNLSEPLCVLIVTEALSVISDGEFDRSLQFVSRNPEEFATAILSIWKDILVRMKRITEHTQLEFDQSQLQYLFHADEALFDLAPGFWTELRKS